MNSIVAQMLGEDDSVPVPATKRSERKRERDPRAVQRRTIAAMMGVREAIDNEERADDDSIFPNDAEEIKGFAGPTGLKLNGDLNDKDREPEEPSEPIYGGQNEPLMSPTVALVAPDVTPQALEPIDPAQVPKPPPSMQPQQPATDPLDVLLGRKTGEPQSMPPIAPVTVESAQAVVNASLGIETGGGLNPGSPMPEHRPGESKKIMEAFYRFGAVRR